MCKNGAKISYCDTMSMVYYYNPSHLIAKKKKIEKSALCNNFDEPIQAISSLGENDDDDVNVCI